MNSKEKAEELLSKYYFQVQTLAKQKQCALIAVDEILNVIDRDMNYQNSYSFYLDVKQQIEEL